MLVLNTYSVFAFFLGGETTNESKSNDADSMLLVELVEDEGVFGRKVRDTKEVEIESSMAIEAGTVANDPSKRRGAMLVKAEKTTSHMDHDIHKSFSCSNRSGRNLL